jgi:hypothetical protein
MPPLIPHGQAVWRLLTPGVVNCFLLAMQKVEDSSPFIRFNNTPLDGVFCEVQAT